ncbi:fumarylacetoacetate hydrolase, partial [Leptospira interrogans serovar Pomona]|nr:fumarylacetoacetate hydrolase [Leptospira interrogans serovar Pomona]
MAKNYVRFCKKNSIEWGKIEDDKIFPLDCGNFTTKDFLESIKKKRKNSKQKPIYVQDVFILSPITAPCQIICQGANYR